LSKKQQQKQQQKQKLFTLKPIVCSVIEKCFRNKKQQGTQQDRQREDNWIDRFWS
jgi:hypothetical protein